MIECRVDSTRNYSGPPSAQCVAETTQQLTSAATTLRGQPADPAQRAEGQALLDHGAVLLGQLGEGPRSTELASALREMERALARMTPDEASHALPSRPTSRRARLAQSAQRSVTAGAMAYRRTGDPEDFANAVVGDMSDRHLRALGRLGESDLRATLAEQGITGEQADIAIDRVKTKIAGKFQRVVRERGLTAIQDTAGRLREASQPGSAEYNRVVGQLLSGNGDELLRTLDALDANTNPIREILQDSTRDDGRILMARFAAHLPPAMNQAAELVSEQADEIAEWSANELTRDAVASRSFPGLAQQVKGRWAMGGIVGEAVNEHVSEARENEGSRRALHNGVILAAGLIAGVFSGGLSAIAIAGLSATAREGVNVQRAYDTSDRTTGRALAGLTSVEEAERARENAENTRRVAGVAIAADMVAGGVISRAHHAARAGGEGARRSIVDVAALTADAAAAIGIEQAAHAATAALNGEEH